VNSTRSILVLALFALTAGSNAQSPIRNGVWSTQSSLNVSYTDRSSPGYFSNDYALSIRPSIARFVSDRVELQLALTYTWLTGTSKFDNAPESAYTHFSGGISTGARYYLSPTEEYALFVGGSIGVSWWLRTTKATWTTPRSVLMAEVGCDIFIVDNVALEPAIRYSRDHEQEVSMTQLAAALGVKYFIAPK
jgi:hypothetical protein